MTSRQLAPAILAPPHPVRTGPEQHHAPVIGVHGKPFAIAPAGFVAAQLERERRALEGGAAIR